MVAYRAVDFIPLGVRPRLARPIDVGDTCVLSMVDKDFTFIVLRANLLHVKPSTEQAFNKRNTRTKARDHMITTIDVESYDSIEAKKTNE